MTIEDLSERIPVLEYRRQFQGRLWPSPNGESARPSIAYKEFIASLLVPLITCQKTFQKWGFRVTRIENRIYSLAEYDVSPGKEDNNHHEPKLGESQEKDGTQKCSTQKTARREYDNRGVEEEFDLHDCVCVLFYLFVLIVRHLDHVWKESTHWNAKKGDQTEEDIQTGVSSKCPFVASNMLMWVLQDNKDHEQIEEHSYSRNVLSGKTPWYHDRKLRERRKRG